MAEPAVWLLDIDGVLNVASRKPPTFVWPRDEWIQSKASDGKHQWSILAARPVVDFIRRTHLGGLAEVRWHTTWQAEAAAVADLLDLPEFEVQEAPEYESYFAERCHDEWWKLPAAMRVAQEGRAPSWRDSRALVWTDDDATGRNLTQRDRDQLAALAPTLIIAPQARLGLMPRHLREIETFLTDHNGRKAT
jgi:hypothetical protein